MNEDIFEDFHGVDVCQFRDNGLTENVNLDVICLKIEKVRKCGIIG